MVTHPKAIEEMARAIASEVGYDFDTLYANKTEWIADRGSRHDINAPYKADMIAAAKAAAKVLLSMEPTQGMLDEVCSGVEPWADQTMAATFRAMTSRARKEMGL